MNSLIDSSDLIKSFEGVLILKSGQRTPSEMSMNWTEEEDTDDCSPEACSPPEHSLSSHHISSSIQTIEELSGVVSCPAGESSSQSSRDQNHPPRHQRFATVPMVDALISASGSLNRQDKSRRVIFPAIHPDGSVMDKTDQNSETSPNSSLFRSQSADALHKVEGGEEETTAANFIPVPTSPGTVLNKINKISIDVEKMMIPPFQTIKVNSTLSANNKPIEPSVVESNIPSLTSTAKHKLLLVPPSFPPHNVLTLPKAHQPETQTKKPNPSILRLGKYSKYSTHLSKKSSQQTMSKTTDNPNNDLDMIRTSPTTSSPRRNRSASCAVEISTSINNKTFWNPEKKNIMRHTSIQVMDSRSLVRFDPRVWVHEFHRPKDENIWFTAAELDRFKYETMQRIQRWTRSNKNVLDFIPSGTGRIISSSSGLRTSGNMSAMRALFSNPALSYDMEDEDEGPTNRIDSSTCVLSTEDIDKTCEREFKSVLLVDSHDIFLNLLTKGIKSILPHVRVTCAYTSEEAWKQIIIARNKDPMSEGGCPHGFDLIIVEERIAFFPHRSRDGVKREVDDVGKGKGVSLGSGSNLIKRIKEEEALMRSSSTSWRKGYSSSLEVR